MTPQELVGRGFDRYIPGLSARFGVHRLNYSFFYSPDGRSLSVCLSGPRRSGEVALDVEGVCRLSVTGGLGRPFMREKQCGESDEDFHEELAALFLYVSEKRDFPELFA